MSDEVSNRRSVKEISSMFKDIPLPTSPIENVTVSAIKKRNSFRNNPPLSDTNIASDDSNVVELRKKDLKPTRSVSCNSSKTIEKNEEDIKKPPLVPRNPLRGKSEANIDFKGNTHISNEETVHVGNDTLAEKCVSDNDATETNKSNVVLKSVENSSDKIKDEDKTVEVKEAQITKPTDDIKIKTNKEDSQKPSTSDGRLSVSGIVGMINSASAEESVPIQKTESSKVKDRKPSEKDDKVIKCKLILKNGEDTCPWSGPRYEFQQHCKENHAHQLALSASEHVMWASTKLYTNTVSVRIFDDEIFWCFHRVTFEEVSKGMMYWTVVHEGPQDCYSIEVAFYLKGNKYKKVLFEEWCLPSDTDIDNAFNCKRCIAIPREILQLYFGVGEDYMDLLFCEATIKKAKNFI